MTSTRQARAAVTRQRILRAAYEAFSTRGYRATSLRDIAADASISHPGLLGHFASKEDLLAHVVEELEAANRDLFRRVSGSGTPAAFRFSQIAAHNAATPGYLALFSALTGEATAPGHPTHERMRARYARLHAFGVEAMKRAAQQGAVHIDRAAGAETTRQMAVWDGLQLLAQYLPERVDVVALLDEYEELLVHPYGWADPNEPAPTQSPSGPLPTMSDKSDAEVGQTGYAVGRERRAQIVADATRLFAQSGYGDTSLREIAEAVGVSKSSLMRHYPTKESLLGAVLSERDRAVRRRVDTLGESRAADLLRVMPTGAVRSAGAEPGLVEVYAVLSCEAVPLAHPAHADFTRRFLHTVDYFADLFRLAQRDGDLPSHREPEREAVRFVALWDGLQYQWLYDHAAVDVGVQLQAHLGDVLPAR